MALLALTTPAASSIRLFRLFSSVAMLLATPAQRALDAAPQFRLFDAANLDQFRARALPTHDRHVPRLHAQRLAQQLGHRFVGAPVFGRRRHRQHQLAVGAEALHPRAPRARPHEDFEPGAHPMRTASSRRLLTTNICRNHSPSIAMNGAKSMPEYVVGNSLRTGLHTRSDTRSRNITIGLL